MTNWCKRVAPGRVPLVFISPGHMAAGVNFILAVKIVGMWDHLLLFSHYGMQPAFDKIVNHDGIRRGI